jgi:hypothetical protein
MTGVFVIKRLPAGQAVDELILLCLGSREDEWEGQVIYLPLR